MTLPTSALPPEAAAALGGAAAAAPPSGKPQETAAPSMGWRHRVAVRHARRRSGSSSSWPSRSCSPCGSAFRDWSGLGSPFEAAFIGSRQLPRAAHRGRHPPPGLRNSIAQHVLLRDHRRPCADGCWRCSSPILVNQRFLRGRGSFRTLLYFPSVTRSIAITLIWLVLFRTSGLVNRILPIADIKWFDEPNGLIHNLLGVFGVDNAPSWLQRRGVRTVDVAVAQRTLRGDVRDHD